MKQILDYPIVVRCFCILLSLFLGWFSQLSYDAADEYNRDYIWLSAGVLVPILISLFAVSVTLIIQSLKELYNKFTNTDKKEQFNNVLTALKDSFLEEIIVLLVLFVLLIIRPFVMNGLCCCMLCYAVVLFDSFVVYSVLLYFWVIADYTIGIISIFKE